MLFDALGGLERVGDWSDSISEGRGHICLNGEELRPNNRDPGQGSSVSFGFHWFCIVFLWFSLLFHRNLESVLLFLCFLRNCLTVVGN